MSKGGWCNVCGCYWASTIRRIGQRCNDSVDGKRCRGTVEPHRTAKESR